MSLPDSRVRVWDQLALNGGLVEEFGVEESPVLAPGLVRFGQLTAFAGMHGSGKSYVLAAVADGLPGWQVRTNLPIEVDGHAAQLKGRYRLKLRQGSEQELIEFSRPIDWSTRSASDAALGSLTATRLTPYVALSDLALVSQEHRFVAKHLGAAAPAVGLVPVNRRGIDALREITGHDYSSLEYLRLEVDHLYFPYVRCVRDSRAIDNWTMSASEFWVHFVLWHLRTSDPDDVVVIDEPETFLAQPAHRSFIDEVARLTLASGCQTIIATHSEVMLRRVPASLIRQVTSSPEGAVISHVASSNTLLRALGRPRSPLAALVYVEDDMAVSIVRAILRIFAPEIADRIDVIDSGGKDEVLRGASITRRSRRLGVAGVLDGDQREFHRDSGVYFLPGETHPEAILLDALHAHADHAAGRLGVPVSDLRMALESTRSAPHQRVFDPMSSCFGSVTANDIRDQALDLWLRSESGAAAARELAEQLITLVAAKEG